MIEVPDSDEDLIRAAYEEENVGRLYEVGCAISDRLRGYIAKRFIECVEYDIWPLNFDEAQTMNSLRHAQQDAMKRIQEVFS